MHERPEPKLKNVVLVRNAYSWQYGGAEQFTYNFAHLLARRGIRPRVVSRVPELLAHCRRDGIATFKNLWLQNTNRRPWLVVYALIWPVLIAQYYWVIRRQRADLMVVMGRDEWIFGTIAAWLAHVPVIWIDHADLKNSVNRPTPIAKRPYYWAMHHAGAVVVPSQAEFAKVAPHLNASLLERFVVINNGALVGSGTPLERPANTKIVAYVGRLERDKGLFDLIEAAAKLPPATGAVQFWLAGKGRDEKPLRQRVTELGLEERFRFLGHLSNVWDLLLAADVFVYPTHHDASPLAPVEALLAGVPVVATKIGGIPEAIPPTAGILVPAHAPDKLVAALGDLLASDTRLRELKAGAAAAAPELDFDAVIERHYLPLFRRVIRDYQS